MLIGGSNDFTKSLISYGYGAYAKWQLLHFFALRADYMGGRLKGDQSRELGNGANPNRAYESFETRLKWTASLSGVFNFGTINWAYRKPSPSSTPPWAAAWRDIAPGNACQRHRNGI